MPSNPVFYTQRERKRARESRGHYNKLSCYFVHFSSSSFLFCFENCYVFWMYYYFFAIISEQEKVANGERERERMASFLSWLYFLQILQQVSKLSSKKMMTLRRVVCFTCDSGKSLVISLHTITASKGGWLDGSHTQKSHK